MKKLLLLAVNVACLSACALPTYEPFTEFATLVATTGSNLVAAVGGVPLGTTPTPGVVGSAATGGVFGGIDLATGGLAAPGGEPWTSLNFSGLNSTGATNGAFQGVDVAVISDPTRFTATALSSLLPPTFPGFPAAGAAITNMAENPSQPAIYNIISYSTNSGVVTTNYGFAMSPNIVGNSPVLQFSQAITRPTNGTATVYVSYLLSVVQQGQLGAGNDGRYLAFLCKSNLVAGIGTANTNYHYWQQMFNKFGAGAPNYAAHGLLLKTANSVYYIGPCDTSAGKNMASSVFYTNFNAPVFVVGGYQFSSAGNDTNAVWVNPSLDSFGGARPPASPIQIDSVANAYKMPDIAGLVLIDRAGNGALGGVGTNYVANLLIGTTWSYVTGGPEFTNQPVSANIFGYGATVSFTGAAVAAGQSVSYQWQHVAGDTTNNLTDGVGTAGGGATVSGSATNTLTLTGVTAGDDAGFYQLVATASGTSYTLTSQPVSITYHTDPFITSSPANTNVNYGGEAIFTATASTAQATMSYQWYFGATPLVNGVQPDGSTVSGATGTVSGALLSSTLTVSNVSYLEAGNYSVLVTNNVNFAVQSTPGSLAVNDPFIVTQPSVIPTVIPVGGTGSVSVNAAGTGLTYQWYGLTLGQLSNGGDFSGVTNATLTIANAQAADADTFYCVVSGSSGQTLTSLNAPVYVEGTQVGPFSQTNDWPPCADLSANANVDYAIWDPSATFSFPAYWNNVLAVPVSSGDQTWNQVTLGGELSYQFTGTYFNIADPLWQKYTNVPVIDILLNVYGNSSMYSANGSGLPITYSYGNVAIATYIHSGPFPLGANNGQWNWMLLSVTNVTDVNGYRTVGDPTYGTGGFGGINNGTMRMEGFNPGLTIRAVAMGPHGVFGTTNQINRFAAPASCAPEPAANLAWIDFNQNASNNLSVMNNVNLGETYTVQSGVGPAGDLRTAIQPSTLTEFPILNNYLGQPCNENLTMQVCLEVYDDPALVGSSFGPFQYATDYQGDLANYTGNPYTLTGSGQWLKVAFYVGPLNLNGVNTAPLTGGPQMMFNGAVPYIDRVEVGLIRTGTNALAGQIPDPNYLLNPLVTAGTNYGYYAEWYPNAGIVNNVDVGSGYSTTVAGPPNDLRICLQPNPIVSGGSASYLIWYLQNQVFGPGYQDNADVIMDLTYYDDPALAGNILYPNVYSTLINGSTSIVSPSFPYNAPLTLQGSGEWKDVLFELPNVNFQVSPSSSLPQYVCRYAASAPVYVSRVRYDVIRPSGPYEGIDYLQRLGLSATNASVNFSWRGTASLLSAPTLTGTYSSAVTTTNTVINVYPAPATNSAGFFRLLFPGYPLYLSAYPPNPY